jgi:signal peptide peptidase-like protein 2B
MRTSIQSVCLWILVLANDVSAILPSGVLEVSLKRRTGDPTISSRMFVAPSSDSGWGPFLPEVKSKATTVYPLSVLHSEDGCKNTSILSRSILNGKYLVLNRGHCSFLDKAIWAKSVGAAGLIIRNTREAVYLLDTNRSRSNFSDSILQPFATDCQQGEAYIPSLHPTHPWLVQSLACMQNPACHSRICLPTGVIHNATFQVCCMWDTLLLMGVNNTRLKPHDFENFPIVFATVGQGENLTVFAETYLSITARLYAREVPIVNIASIALWFLGIVTAVVGAFYAVRISPHLKPRDMESKSADEHNEEGEEDNQVLDLSWHHAIGFVLSAGAFITLLYFAHIGPVLAILFGMSSISTVTSLLTGPLLMRLFPPLSFCVICNVLITDIVAILTSLSLVIVWYFNRHQCWYLQNLFGITLCFVFLKTMRLPKLSVGAWLLGLAFLYDIFFVFVTPLLFGRSVMVDVASGGPAAASMVGYPGLDYCERYPRTPICIDPEPLPMLLIFPRVLDWRQGRAMLGLGDIVLPGLLLVFALRFDDSQQKQPCQGKRMSMRFNSDVANEEEEAQPWISKTMMTTMIITRPQSRYFVATSLGYAVGLALANMAVAWMHMGQPALMYLVPCTLGALIGCAHVAGDLHVMWHEGVDRPRPSMGTCRTTTTTVDDEAPLLLSDNQKDMHRQNIVPTEEA